MSDWTLKLCVAIIAASGVIVAALIGLWKDRKGRRETILHDLEILEKLPNPSLVHVSLAQYVDKRALFLSVEDKIGLYIFSGGALVVIFIFLTVAIFVGVTTKHLAWSFVAAAVIVIIAILVVAYRYSIVKLTDWSKREIEKNTRATAIELVRNNITESAARDEVFENFYKEFPEPLRAMIKEQLGPFGERKIDEIVESAVDTFLSGNRYSDWSPKLESTPVKDGIKIPIKLKFLIGILRIYNAFAQWRTKWNKGAPPQIAEAMEPSPGAT